MERPEREAAEINHSNLLTEQIMARPQKNNAEYFSHDADMRNDVKVKALRRKFQHTGYAVWCFILESLTDGEYFEIDYNELNRELLAADFDVPVELLEEIVDYCCKVGLLQMTDDQHLYSEAHQRRFASLMEKRKRDRERLTRLINRRQHYKNGDNEAETSDNDSYHGDNPHSIVNNNREKESKQKENREKKNIQYPYQGIADLWNSVCVSLPKVQKLSEARRQKIKCRCDEWGKTPDVWMQTAEDIFRRIQASDFLKGSNGHQWVATFDWLFSNSGNSIKVMEGNYDNKRGTAQTQADDSRAKLGVGEYIDKETGRRTYGSGKATIPQDAPPRPSDKHAWDSATAKWVLL